MLATILILIVLSILAILAELVLPAGILGIAGTLGLFAAVYLIFGEYGVTVGLVSAIALGIFGIAVMWFWMKYFHRLPFTRKMVHRTEVGEDQARIEFKSLKGKSGRTLTDLCPSGRALIDGQRVDVVAESGFIDRDADVRVVGASGATAVVRVAD